MSQINWSELFPTRDSAVIFFSYIFLFVSHGLLVIGSQNSNNNYDYNVSSVIIITELLKLILCVLLYWKNNNISNLFKDIAANNKLLVLYSIPSFLYCIYNILSFVNLSNFDLTTYSLLLNFRVVVTGVLFQILFKRLLSRIQWISLIILTLGCMLIELDFGENSTSNNLTPNKLNTIFVFLLILLQVLCSCFAGVYCELLLKNEGTNVSIYVQNIFMYLDSIVCNTLVLFFQGEGYNVINKQNLSVLLHPTIGFLILNTAIAGIVTSFFLKSLNSIIKTFASALELIITTTFNFILFGVPIHWNTVLSIIVVCIAIILYSKNPVVNKKVNEKLDDTAV